MQAVNVAPYPREKTLFTIHALISGIFLLVVLVSTFGMLLVYGAFAYIAHIFGFSYFISYIRGTAARITPEQFPDLYARIETGCAKLGIETIPESYLMQSDGALNAFAAKFIGRHFVVLFSPIVEALDERPDALDFYIGHELGHIHRGHTGWLKSVLVLPSSILPLIGAAYRRAQEYTCDRYGHALCNNPDDAEYALAVISAGSKRWAQLNRDAFIQQSAASSGFWMSYHELMSDYPWLSKRMLALRALSSGESIKAPSRHILAKLLALVTPRIPGGGGLASLILVVAVIGIGAAIALPAYQDYTARAALAPFDQSASKVLMTLRATTDVDTTNELLDKLSETPAGKAFEQYGELTVDDGVVTLTPKAGGASQLDLLTKGALGAKSATNSLQFTPAVDSEDKVTWTCSTQRIKYAPAFCK